MTCNSMASPSASATTAGRRWVPHERQGHRRGVEAVPVVRPAPSRKVVVPFASVLAVPVIRPLPSRKVFCPFESVVMVALIRPLASRITVCCAIAVVASVSAAMRAMIPSAGLFYVLPTGEKYVRRGFRPRDDQARPGFSDFLNRGLANNFFVSSSRVIACTPAPGSPQPGGVQPGGRRAHRSRTAARPHASPQTACRLP